MLVTCYSHAFWPRQKFEQIFDIYHVPDLRIYASATPATGAAGR